MYYIHIHPPTHPPYSHAPSKALSAGPPLRSSWFGRPPQAPTTPVAITAQVLRTSIAKHLLEPGIKRNLEGSKAIKNLTYI